MAQYSIVIIDNESGVKYHLAEFKPVANSEFYKLEATFEFGPTKFSVQKKIISSFVKDSNNETNDSPNTTKKSKQPTSKS